MLFRYCFISSHLVNMCFSHTYLPPLLKTIEGRVQIILQLFNYQNMKSIISATTKKLCSDELWKYIGQINTYSLYISSVISFTWVAEKSTHCKNAQFSPNACKDTSVIPKQPPKSMIFNSRQLSARARTPSSVRLQHLFKEASCR